MADSTTKVEFLLLALLQVCLCFAGGCRKPELNTQYGKISGSLGSDSVNGVSVFADMFDERGFTVKRRQKISPKINRYGTIVWFPDDYSCPSNEAILALTEWLDGDYDRTLIYVGRDYDSRTDYLGDVLEAAPVDQKEELLRQIAEGRVIQDRQTDASTFFATFHEETTSCEWFEQEQVTRRKSTSLSGPWSDDLDQEVVEIELSTILKPPVKEKEWSKETLLAEGDDEIVVALRGKYNVFNENRVIVVANGSFLLNYTLVNREHRQLATKLIDQCDSNQGVVFLESGPRGIEVSDSDTTNHNIWAWVAQPPLRYIVPHFLVWGILFCLVFFPIFGRPKRVQRRNISTFRTHINAMGKLIGKSNLPNRAINKIRDYQHLVSGESKRHQQD